MVCLSIEKGKIRRIRILKSVSNTGSPILAEEKSQRMESVISVRNQVIGKGTFQM